MTLGAIGVYVWGALKWNDSRVDPTDKTIFRSWRVNFINFMVAAGITLINLVFSWVFRNIKTTNDFMSYGEVTAAFIGAAAVVCGIFLGWRMENLWWQYDQTGALAK